MRAINITSAVAFVLLGAAPAVAQSFQGVTCEDVRRLSPEEQNYWSKRLKLTAQQRHRIYVACYRKYVGHRRPDADTLANAAR